MLQELDRRDALSSPNADIPPSFVRAVEEAHGREWFWGIVGALMLAAVAWVGWVAYQLQPRVVATEKALKAADEARVRPQPPVARPAPQVAAPAVIAPEPKPAPEIPPVAKAE